MHGPNGGKPLRYDVVVEMMYLAGRDRLPEDARTALRSAVAEEVAVDKSADVTLAGLAVDQRGADVAIRAMLRGNGPSDLTRPLDAVTRIDTAVCRSLLRLGLFEEFDVSGRSLTAAPTVFRTAD